jgi:hypothetical protein
MMNFLLIFGAIESKKESLQFVRCMLYVAGGRVQVAGHRSHQATSIKQPTYNTQLRKGVLP